MSWPDPRHRPIGQDVRDLPEGIPPVILTGGFDHREPHPDDNGVQFEAADQERTGWDDEQVAYSLDHRLVLFQQQQERATALGTSP